MGAALTTGENDMRPRHTLTLLASAALAAATLTSPGTAGAASYGGPDRRAAPTWNVISSGTVSSLSEISTARTGDGVVHAFYRQDTASGAHIEHTALTSSAGPAFRNTVVALGGVAEVAPAMVTPSGGLRVVFAGLGDGPAGDGRPAGATSDASGAARNVLPRSLVKISTAYSG